jgi:uncharacterized membrane protein YbjE (DUF340 family)
MGTALTILTILGAVGLGLLGARVPVLRTVPASPVFSRLRGGVLAAMIAVMGFRIGRTDDVIRNAGSLGLASLLFAAATLAGTLAVLVLAFEIRKVSRGGAVGDSRAGVRRDGGSGGLLREPLLLLGMLGLGFLFGFFVPVFPAANGGQLVTILLYVLLVLIGMGLGTGSIHPRQILTHPDLLLIPLGTMVGTLAGGLAAGLALHIRPGASLSLASGFGWYSLSGVLLTRLGSPGLGAVSFLSNMLRESMALLLIPLLARTRYPFLAIGAGGATSMDVTLPLIEKNCGPRAVPLSIASGGMLSLSVPFLVPLLFRLGV